MRPRISKEIREIVRERANGRCEYCGIPERDHYAPHHVDHIIPPILGGTGETDNLAWACYMSNSIKSAHIGTYDRKSNTFTPLFHPREDIWSDHIEMNDGEIVGKTPIGQITVSLLRMNTPNRLEQRRLMIELDEWDDDGVN